MRFKKIIAGCAFLGMLMPLARQTDAQDVGRPDFEIKPNGIQEQQVEAPEYGASGVLGGRPSSLWRTWLKIEVQFSSKADWADDVQVKYYVLMGPSGAERLFIGDVTHINVAKGTQHYSGMFMQPNTLKRYGAERIAAIEVRIFHKGVIVASASKPSGLKNGWWDNYPQTSGFLLPPQDTPWAPIADQRFEEVKPTSHQSNP